VCPTDRGTGRALATPEISKHIANNGLVVVGVCADFGPFLAREKR
jgi:hypothetical protein